VSVGKAKARIGEGIRSAGEAAGPIHAVAAQVGDLATMLAGTTLGSSHQKVTLSLSRLGEAKKEAERVETLLRSGIDAAHEYLKILG
jgi:hypothetical protein